MPVPELASGARTARNLRQRLRIATARLLNACAKLGGPHTRKVYLRCPASSEHFIVVCAAMQHCLATQARLTGPLHCAGQEQRRCAAAAVHMLHSLSSTVTAPSWKAVPSPSAAPAGQMAGRQCWGRCLDPEVLGAIACCSAQGEGCKPAATTHSKILRYGMQRDDAVSCPAVVLSGRAGLAPCWRCSSFSKSIAASTRTRRACHMHMCWMECLIQCSSTSCGKRMRRAPGHLSRSGAPGWYIRPESTSAVTVPSQLRKLVAHSQMAIAIALWKHRA
jgi:hypothetical protein